MGWGIPSPRDEFCRHLGEAVDLLAWASRELRLAHAFAPTCSIRRSIKRKRCRVEAIRRASARMHRCLCRWC